MAHLAVVFGWQTMWVVPAGGALLTSVMAAVAWVQERRRAVPLELVRPVEGQ